MQAPFTGETQLSRLALNMLPGWASMWSWIEIWCLWPQGLRGKCGSAVICHGDSPDLSTRLWCWNFGIGGWCLSRNTPRKNPQTEQRFFLSGRFFFDWALNLWWVNFWQMNFQRPNVTEVALVDENWKPSSGDLNESKASPGGFWRPHRGGSFPVVFSSEFGWMKHPGLRRQGSLRRLGGGFQDLIFTLILGEMEFKFDILFQMGGEQPPTNALKMIRVVVSFFFLNPYLGKRSKLTGIFFQNGLVQPPTSDAFSNRNLSKISGTTNFWRCQLSAH